MLAVYWVVASEWRLLKKTKLKNVKLKKNSVR